MIWWLSTYVDKMFIWQKSYCWNLYTVTNWSWVKNGHAVKTARVQDLCLEATHPLFGDAANEQQYCIFFWSFKNWDRCDFIEHFFTNCKFAGFSTNVILTLISLLKIVPYWHTKWLYSREVSSRPWVRILTFSSLHFGPGINKWTDNLLKYKVQWFVNQLGLPDNTVRPKSL